MAPPRQSRAFTLSQPPPTTRRNKPQVKRSKTYTGCWTCRSRGLKCDEERPQCNRCLRSNVSCGGYHVKLVWDVGHGASVKPAERRLFVTPHDALRPALSSREINLALAEIDEAGPHTVVQAGPFAVFPASFTPETPIASPDPPDVVEYGQDDHTSPGTSEEQGNVLELCHTFAREEESDGHPVVRWMDEVDRETSNDTEAAIIMISIKERVLPQMPTYLSTASAEERSLFHYWVTLLSGRMIPTQCQDNPFRTVFIPLALVGASPTQEYSGNGALLHAIYAVSAFHRAQLSSSSEHFLSLATKHHKTALAYLRNSLMQPEESQKEAVLATIIAMSTIDVVRGNPASWRIHLAGGRTWLRHMMQKGNIQSAGASVLCQIFFCINVMGQSLPQHIDGLEDLQGTNPESVDQMRSWENPYVLGKIFGITKPVLEGIVRINTLSDPAYHATQEEIDDLDLFIRRNDPDLLISDMTEEYDEITRHHGCAFFCASLIHFERRVRKTSPRRLQRLVQRGLDHLDAVDLLEAEKKLDACGLLWPMFVTACEAEFESNLQARALHIFQKESLIGIGNVSSATQILEEVWRRRHNDCEGLDITWQSVMADMEMDILLT